MVSYSSNRIIFDALRELQVTCCCLQG